MPSAYILGLGKSGTAAAKLLKAKGWQVLAVDEGNSSSLRSRQEELAQDGIATSLGQTFQAVLNNRNERDARNDQAASFEPPDLVVVSPGIPWDNPALVVAREQGLAIIGEVELAWQSLQQIPWVGITGTNGKTTTTALVAAIFQAAGYHAPACGNIGIPACEIALQALQQPDQAPDWIIAELSSYQIESACSISPKIGIWTTFTPDHLKRHHTIESYSSIKASLIHRSQQIILNREDPYLAERGAALWPNAIWCATHATHGSNELESDHSGAIIKDNLVMFNGEPVMSLAKLRLIGDHNRQNLLMAVAAARLAGIAPEVIEKAVAEFPGVSHRLEHIIDHRGISLINDSKATNYDAAEVALDAVDAPVVLIAGGDPKNGDATAWLRKIKQKAIAVLLIGVAAPKFAQLLDENGYSGYEIVNHLDVAVPKAVALAIAHRAKAVLFSPACASFDQYANFEQRGDHFRQLCHELDLEI
ncbi:UDP-N-acetylmuramoylalanine--D-glutamate ligase [Thalassoporum mexicanum PCC 7367]|uniref:UDP-N-acetylmuramoyl-L-alanine--D-glutamate ligase n=1 Tax=Thalassoporum mexicanum TaxID=3457544 RepID=UPI00029FEBB4|nr:UDP-N-acetylmuramoyl-L-alanine--D-glutamate ligase [Pseudanabaena sp. PCC 7367]AFY68773.1 UDP-N-acetylmuramoylalanine--D-glutamate ligase [Pseudanabaena sp. PCC 7367]